MITPTPLSTSLTAVAVIPVEAGVETGSSSAQGVVGQGPTQKKARVGFMQPFFKAGLTSVAAIGLALMVGFGAVGTAHAQEATTTATTCARDAAHSAAVGAELGRALTGDVNGGRIGGALAALIHRANCTDSATNATPTASPEMQRYNTELEEALRQDSTKFLGNAELSDGLKQVLRYLADEARRQPSLKIVVLAHANEADTVTFVNRNLANERARNVLAFLVDHGVARARVESSGTSDGDGQNRVQILVIEGRPAANTNATGNGTGGGNFLGIPGLTIELGRDRQQPNANGGQNGRQNGVQNGTVNGGHTRTTPGPNGTGWNGR